MSSSKRTILTGTIILTLSGIVSRLLGFYNRILLSKVIGARELGVYQLIFPVYLLCFTLCCHGFETGISNMTSRFASMGQRKNIKKILCLTCLINFSLSLVLMLLLFHLSDWISLHILCEASAAAPLRIASLALPWVAVKSCLHGYYIGLNSSLVPAVSQLAEQCVRVGSIYCFSVSLYGMTADARIAVYGMLFGEIASTLYTIASYGFHQARRQLRTLFHKKPFSSLGAPIESSRTLLKEFFRFSLPLSVNHFSLSLIGSAENVLIPGMLTLYFGNRDTSLTVFGTLTGMALPFLYFPATITNSMSVMVMPAISSSYKQKNRQQIKTTVSLSLHYCMMIGMFAVFAFLLYGSILGQTVFHSTEAGHYIRLFSFLCPLMYTTGTTSSILNGFGLTGKTLYHHLLSEGLRILLILLLIPRMGVCGYLWGLAAGYGLLLLLDLRAIQKMSAFSFDPKLSLLYPTLGGLLGGVVSRFSFSLLIKQLSVNPFLILTAAGSLYTIFFIIMMFLWGGVRFRV